MRFPGQVEKAEKPAPPADLDPALTLAVAQYRGVPLPERITSAHQYRDIDREAQDATRVIRRIEDWFAPLVAAAFAAHKALTTRRAALTGELQAGVDARDRLLKAFDRRMVEETGAVMHASVKGSSRRENWQARVTNEDAVPDAYWIVDVSRLIQEAKATKGPSTIPGVEFYDEGTIARRA